MMGFTFVPGAAINSIVAAFSVSCLEATSSDRGSPAASPRLFFIFLVCYLFLLINLQIRASLLSSPVQKKENERNLPIYLVRVVVVVKVFE
mmetsp:Transcript_30947/g.37783  ORF Transcript_30947/g.37783 Transcript_30947/m.37783 type:complete len:91 (-) Transcript_30947:232-504(-)